MKTRIDMRVRAVLRARAFLSYVRERRRQLLLCAALALVAGVMGFCTMSCWYTYRMMECIGYELDGSRSVPQYCFEEVR